MATSKQAKAKQLQGYTTTQSACETCKHFSSKTVQVSPGGEWYEPFTKEKNMKCNIGGFAVKKKATCKMHEFA